MKFSIKCNLYYAIEFQLFSFRKSLVWVPPFQYIFFRIKLLTNCFESSKGWKLSKLIGVLWFFASNLTLVKHKHSKIFKHSLFIPSFEGINWQKTRSRYIFSLQILLKFLNMFFHVSDFHVDSIIKLTVKSF